MRAANANVVNLFNRAIAERFLSLGLIPDHRFGKTIHVVPLLADDWLMRQQDGFFLLIIAVADAYGDIFERIVVVNAPAGCIIDCCQSHTQKNGMDRTSTVRGPCQIPSGCGRSPHTLTRRGKEQAQRPRQPQTNPNQISKKQLKRDDASYLKLHCMLFGNGIVDKINK